MLGFKHFGVFKPVSLPGLEVVIDGALTFGDRVVLDGIFKVFVGEGDGTALAKSLEVVGVEVAVETGDGAGDGFDTVGPVAGFGLVEVDVGVDGFGVVILWIVDFVW